MIDSFTDLLNWYWWVPILIGFSLIFAIYYYRRRAQQLAYSLKSLYELNQQVHQDALDFIEKAWPVLKRFYICRVEMKGQWFGEPIHYDYQSNQVCYHVHCLEIKEQDIELYLTFYLPKLNTEQLLLNQTVVQTFFHLLQSDARLKQVQVLSALNHLQRYQLHLQHDLKNINQGVQLIAQQLQTVTPEQCSAFITYLKTTFPLISQQLQALLKPFTVRQNQVRVEPVQLKPILADIAERAGLEVNFVDCNEIALLISESLLKQIFENLLFNFRDHEIENSQEQVPIQIKCEIASTEESRDIEIFIFMPKSPVLPLKPERLFEPFWTTSESGMGLGLFLVRELLKDMNGRVEVVVHTDSYGFKVCLPVRYKI